MNYFVLLFFLYSVQTLAQTKVAILDAFFCENKIHQKNIQIKRIQDLTEERNPLGKGCADTRQFHGQKVLSTFLEYYKDSKSIEIYLYKVFKRDGSQDVKALVNALNEVKKEKIDLMILAIGFFDHPSLPRTLPTLTFAASGSSGNGIKASDKLWPQMLDEKNLVLFAHYFPSKSGSKMIPGNILQGHFDSSLMNLSKVNYIVDSTSPSARLNGSSFAVAKASGIILSRCDSLKKIDRCLIKFSQSVKILSNSPMKLFSVIN